MRLQDFSDEENAESSEEVVKEGTQEIEKRPENIHLWDRREVIEWAKFLSEESRKKLASMELTGEGLLQIGRKELEKAGLPEGAILQFDSELKSKILSLIFISLSLTIAKQTKELKGENGLKGMKKVELSRHGLFQTRWQELHFIGPKKQRN